MTDSMNVLALVKGGEQYVFLYDPASHDALVGQLGKYAADPELNFSWSDAAVLARKARDQVEAEVPFSLDDREDRAAA